MQLLGIWLGKWLAGKQRRAVSTSLVYDHINIKANVIRQTSLTPDFVAIGELNVH